LLIAPIEAPDVLAVVRKEPLVFALLVTPPLAVCTSKLNVQIDFRLTGAPLPASEQSCANGCAAFNISFVIASNRGTSLSRSIFRSSMKVARLHVFAPTTR
jgi:hypothetical protein